MPTSVGQWAETVTRLAGDEVRSGPVQDLLAALERAGKLSAGDMATLLVICLREKAGEKETTIARSCAPLLTWQMALARCAGFRPPTNGAFLS
jgi:hypothetical protein